jgi:hypothetical protein
MPATAYAAARPTSALTPGTPRKPCSSGFATRAGMLSAASRSIVASMVSRYVPIGAIPTGRKPAGLLGA